jgi:hypothetical protein
MTLSMMERMLAREKSEVADEPETESDVQEDPEEEEDDA